jgi:O-methyltransferase involved in polyketide biosynthesis
MREGVSRTATVVALWRAMESSRAAPTRLFEDPFAPALTPQRIQVTTGSGVEFVPRITLDKIVALGQERIHFPVLGHTLPPSAGIDGLLG